jgi:DNA-directed RNA polymerase specialized sigma24 family protein
MPKARCRDKQLAGLMKDEAERLIEQSNLGREDAQIARLYLIDQIPQIEIAVEMDYERSTISRRLGQIRRRMRHTRREMRKETHISAHN